MNRGMTRREREVTDPIEMKRILDTAKILHLGLCYNNEPYVVAMNYGYTLENDELTLYLHGATMGKKLDMMRENPNVFFEMECDVIPFQGDVACKFGTSYSSIMGRGVASFITEPNEKATGLSLLMKTQTGKNFDFNEKLVKVVSIIQIRVTDFTAKHRPLPKQN